MIDVGKKIFSDIFVSYEGEAPFFGMPTIFLRFAGCDVGCKFCDEKKSWSTVSAQYSIEDFHKMVNYPKLKETHILSFTGGEPMQHLDFPDVLDYFHTRENFCDKMQLQTSGHFHPEVMYRVREKLSFVDIIISPKKLKVLKEKYLQAWYEVFTNTYITKRYLKLLAGNDSINNFNTVCELAEFFDDGKFFLQAITSSSTVDMSDRMVHTVNTFFMDEMLKALKETDLVVRPTMQQHPFLNLK